MKLSPRRSDAGGHWLPLRAALGLRALACQTFDAPPGTLVLVEPSERRGARAEEAGAVVRAAWAPRRKPFSVSE